MKKILTFLVFCLTITLSQAQTSQKNYPLHPNGTVEFSHTLDDDIYYLIYRDTTSFPDFEIYEGLTEETYIFINCKEEDFFDYLEWFSKQDKQSKEFFKESNKFVITEVTTPVEGGDNYQYFLTRKPE